MRQSTKSERRSFINNHHHRKRPFFINILQLGVSSSDLSRNACRKVRAAGFVVDVAVWCCRIFALFALFCSPCTIRRLSLTSSWSRLSSHLFFSTIHSLSVISSHRFPVLHRQQRHISLLKPFTFFLSHNSDNASAILFLLVGLLQYASCILAIDDHQHEDDSNDARLFDLDATPSAPKESTTRTPTVTHATPFWFWILSSTKS